MERVTLPHTFFLMSIVGFVVSATYTYSGALGLSWGFAFCLVFMIMFVASVASITPSADDLKEIDAELNKNI